MAHSQKAIKGGGGPWIEEPTQEEPLRVAGLISIYHQSINLCLELGPPCKRRPLLQPRQRPALLLRRVRLSACACRSQRDGSAASSYPEADALGARRPVKEGQSIYPHNFVNLPHNMNTYIYKQG